MVRAHLISSQILSPSPLERPSTSWKWLDLFSYDTLSGYSLTLDADVIKLYYGKSRKWCLLASTILKSWVGNKCACKCLNTFKCTHCSGLRWPQIYLIWELKITEKKHRVQGFYCFWMSIIILQSQTLVSLEICPESPHVCKFCLETGSSLLWQASRLGGLGDDHSVKGIHAPLTCYCELPAALADNCHLSLGKHGQTPAEGQPFCFCWCSLAHTALVRVLLLTLMANVFSI